MFSSKKLAIFVVLVMIAPMVLAACGPTPEPPPPETIIQTVEVEVTKVVEVEGEEVTVVETVVVEKEVTAEPQPEPTEEPPAPAEPQTYRMGIFEDATTTNYWAYLDPDSSVWNAYILGNMHPAAYTLAYPNIYFVPQMADGMLEPAAE
jgi:hypothetical protein